MVKKKKKNTHMIPFTLKKAIVEKTKTKHLKRRVLWIEGMKL